MFNRLYHPGTPRGIVLKSYQDICYHYSLCSESSSLCNRTRKTNGILDWKDQLSLFIGNMFIDETQENQVKTVAKLEPLVR